MAYLTARKRVLGLGATGRGTDHFWNQTVSSIALLILVPLFVFTFGPTLGLPYDQAASYYARPFPALVAVLTLVVGLIHFKNGARIAIEDYTQGHLRQGLIVAVTCISYVAIAAGLFALVKLAL